ncbi:MAG: hypothetical protein AAF245_01925 [Pseudomonadota bacterium]
MKLLLTLCLLPLPLWAACPPAPDREDERAALHTDLLNAGDEREAQIIAGSLWEIWLTAPDAKAQELLDRGMSRREAFDFEASEDAFDALLAYCPRYPEAHNQRAFTRFMRQDFEGSLADIDTTLSLNPYHFGALSGRALIYMQQGRSTLVQQALRDALRVHPFLRERALLIEKPGDDI